ncbi:MAG: RloB family protein [bacterium]|jgi:hypothetical protein|nr:RloB family protein [bacterium]
MIIRSREFKRNPPSRDAKKIYIFCEGKTRESEYFNFFEGLDSRVSIRVCFLKGNENNTPEGLLNIAKEKMPICSFEPENNDEVWIVFDTDADKFLSREPQINLVRDYCSKTKNWFHAESNPCFELWLYYHFAEKPSFEGFHISKIWKSKLNEFICGGFDSRKYPLFIADAIENAKSNYIINEAGRPIVGSTELFKLGETIYKMMSDKIDRMRKDSE